MHYVCEGTHIYRRSHFLPKNPTKGRGTGTGVFHGSNASLVPSFSLNTEACCVSLMAINEGKFLSSRSGGGSEGW